VLDSRREEATAKDMTISHERINCSIPALIKCGFVGLSQIGEIDGLVIAWREVNFAQRAGLENLHRTISGVSA
jgi:hypothetical protein